MMDGRTPGSAHPQSCPICRSPAVRGYCRKAPADYYRCEGCRLIFQHPLPARDSMIAYADREYESGKYREYVEAKPMKLQHFEHRLARLRESIRPGRLLDVGCSAGYFLEVAAAQGFDVRGVEFSHAAIAAAAPEIRPRIFEGTLEGLHSDGSFDVISAFDLIEHVHSPSDLVQRAMSLLAPGGHIVLSTPDTDHFLRPLMRSRWPMLQPMQHLFLFSRQALRHLLEAGGFQDVRIEPAQKTLSFDYLVDQIGPLNPSLSRMLAGVGRWLPASLTRKYWHVNIGELMAVGRRAG